MERVLASALGFLDAHAELAGPGLCLLSFVSALFLIGAAVPVTAATLSAGAAVALSDWAPSTALWAMGGLAAGSCVSYELGRRLPARSREILARKAPRYFTSAERLIGRHGAAATVVSRFVGPPATVPFIAGYLGLPRPRFWIANAISALWAPLVMLLGYGGAVGALRLS